MGFSGGGSFRGRSSGGSSFRSGSRSRWGSGSRPRNRPLTDEEVDEFVFRSSMLLPKFHDWQLGFEYLNDMTRGKRKEEKWDMAATGVAMCGSEKSKPCEFWREILADCPPEIRDSLVSESKELLTRRPPEPYNYELVEQMDKRLDRVYPAKYKCKNAKMLLQMCREGNYECEPLVWDWLKHCPGSEKKRDES